MLLAAFPVAADAADDTGTWTGGEVEGSDIAAYVLVTSSGETVATLDASPSGTIIIRCYYYGLTPVPDSQTPGPDMTAGPVWPPEEGGVYFLYCYDGTDLVHGELLLYDPGNPFGTLARAEDARDLALSRLTLPPPAIALAPPAGDVLVGLPAWYWVDMPWEPQEVSATLGGITATVTAEPTDLTFVPGDGSTAVRCDGPGVAWTPDRTGDPPCGHTYVRQGEHAVTATITWIVTWSATTGAGGPLPDLTTTATLPVVVEEVEAVIR
jgi:hypothetical protein